MSEETGSLRHELSALYGIKIHALNMVMDGVNTTFSVGAEEGCFFLRLYRSIGRSYSDIAFEHQALTEFPNSQHVNVSKPVKDKHGHTVCRVNYKDNLRLAALFTSAAGQKPDLRVDVVRLFGTSLACFHQMMASFEGKTKRRLPDIAHYIDDINSVKPEIVSELNKASRLSQLVEREGSFCNRAFALQHEQFCHGDAWLGNIHVDADTVTFFDLDDCGIGSPIYDIATFAWWMLRTKSDPAFFMAFKDSYLGNKQNGALSFSDLPFFVVKNEIRSLAFLVKYNLLDETMLKETVDGADLLLKKYFSEADQFLPAAWQ